MSKAQKSRSTSKKTPKDKKIKSLTVEDLAKISGGNVEESDELRKAHEWSRKHQEETGKQQTVKG